jgi:quinol monooxygenase YgiN
MFITRNESDVTLGRTAEYESTVDELVALHGQSSGFIGATLLQSFGNPSRHTLTQRWTEREAARASVRSDKFAAFARALTTSGLFRPLRLTEAYESVFEVDAPDADPNTSTCEIWIDWTLKSPAVAPAFESFSRDISELARRHAPGFVSSRLRRFLGDDVRYLAIAIVTDRAAARARYVVPELKAFLDMHPYTEFALAPATAEVYSVVKRHVGPAAPAMQTVAAATSIAR